MKKPLVVYEILNPSKFRVDESDVRKRPTSHEIALHLMQKSLSAKITAISIILNFKSKILSHTCKGQLLLKIFPKKNFMVQK